MVSPPNTHSTEHKRLQPITQLSTLNMARNYSTANRTMMSLNEITVNGVKMSPLPGGVLIGRKGIMKKEIERRSRATIQLRGELIHIQGGAKERRDAKILIQALAQNFHNTGKAGLPSHMTSAARPRRAPQPKMVTSSDGWSTITAKEQKTTTDTSRTTSVPTSSRFSGLEMWDSDDDEEEVEVEKTPIAQAVSQPALPAAAAAQPEKSKPVPIRWADDESSSDEDEEDDMFLGAW